jgi:hypothetical protein
LEIFRGEDSVVTELGRGEDHVLYTQWGDEILGRAFGLVVCELGSFDVRDRHAERAAPAFRPIDRVRMRPHRVGLVPQEEVGVELVRLYGEILVYDVELLYQMVVAMSDLLGWRVGSHGHEDIGLYIAKGSCWPWSKGGRDGYERCRWRGDVAAEYGVWGEAFGGEDGVDCAAD